MKRRAYIETSIPSFYFEERSDPDLVARRDSTLAWWNDPKGAEKVTSLAELEDLRRGDFVAREACLALVDPLPVVVIEKAIVDIVDA